MTTRSYLASLGVTMTQAHQFIKANLNSPENIYKVAQQYRIDSQMLADIMSIDYPGVTAAGVESFFSSRGLSGSALRSKIADNTSKEAVFPTGFESLNASFMFNTNTGALSNESLRAAVISKTGMENYLFAFAPINFKGADDGVFTAAELGVNGFGPMAATWQNIESVFYGTIINLLMSVDTSEIQNIEDFIVRNQTALNKGNTTVFAQLQNLVIQMYQTPATDPYFTDAQLVNNMRDNTAEVVTLIGQNSLSSVFSGFFNGF